MLARQEQEDYDVAQEERQTLRKAAKGPLYKTVVDTGLRNQFQVLFAVAAVLAMIVTIQSGIIASRGYQLVSVQEQAEQPEEANKRLNVDIDKLKAPQRIKSVAADKLGMIVPNKIYFSHDN